MFQLCGCTSCKDACLFSVLVARLLTGCLPALLCDSTRQPRREAADGPRRMPQFYMMCVYKHVKHCRDNSVCVFFFLFFFNFCFQLLKKYINTQLWRVLSVIYSRCLECFGSSATSSLSDVCQFNPARFCKTSNELNIICQCHMKAQCVFQE